MDPVDRVTTARAAVVREAEGWISTPFHHEARLKGVGVDCGQLLIAVYGACGFVPADLQVEHYPPDFAMHRDREWYLEVVKRFARRVDAPGIGDAVLFKLGRLYSHGGIVTRWPMVIHAAQRIGKVMLVNVDKDNDLNERARLFYSPFEGG